MLFFLSYTAHCLMAHRIILRYVGGTEKNAWNLNWILSHAANSDRIASWRIVHHCVNISEQEYLFFILFYYISLSLYLYSLRYLRLPLSISISLPISFFLAISISLRVFAENNNNSKRGNAAKFDAVITYLYCFTWGERKYVEIEDDVKI